MEKKREIPIEIDDIENDLLLESEVVSTYNAISEIEKSEQKKYINQVISNLKEDDALLITLFYLQENTIDEISEICQFSLSNVKVKLHRARKRFYNELKAILKDEVKEIL